MLENFHFIRPLWLLALIPLSLLAWRLYRRGGGDNPWHRIVDARLLPLLMSGPANSMNHLALCLLAGGWIIAILALSGPTWERNPQPVYQTMAARVIVLDLSRSMNATDLKPSRLVRARYKVEDVLTLGMEGQTGLVVYAGDAFTVSPLTRDVNTVRALLKVLEPNIMPVEGNRADLGLLKAGDLLRQAGAPDGQVLLITDGPGDDNVAASEAAAARLRKDGHRVSVLGVGSGGSAALTNEQGQRLHDAAGRIMDPRLDTAALESVARAGGGEYRSITDSGEALGTLLREARSSHAQATTQTDATAQGWKEQGPLLAVLLLPLAALAFRRNWLVCLVLAAALASPPQPAMAVSWNDLWSRKDQQAAKALEGGDYVSASKLATDARLRGSAEYKRGNYQAALDNFSQATGADADYNRANALARLGRYQDAIAAYDKSLRENPDGEDARVNKAAVEALLEQQQQAQQPPSNSQDESSQNKQSQSDGGDENSSQGDAQKNSSQENGQAQADASSGQEQPPMNANKADNGSPNGETPSERDKDVARERQKDVAQQNAASGKESEQQEPPDPDASQQKDPDNQFAEAAKKLAGQGADEPATDDQPANDATTGNAPDQTQANAQSHTLPGPADSAQQLDSEEAMAAEQWLRRIPDDPGGLLRRKFLYQYQQRVQRQNR
jgi:Ca-activated chloride channel family protein